MALISREYFPSIGIEDNEKDWQFFCQNLQLLLRHKQTILACSDYFFCSLSFSKCSWAWVANDGPLVIGYLLLSWQNRLLIQPCPDKGCGGEILITSFSGSPLSGSNSFAGYCTNCRNRKSSSRTDIKFYELINFVQKLRQTFPAVVQEIEEYDGYQFCWGGSGLQPARKTRLISKPVANPVTLAVLVDELRAGTIRKGSPVNVHLLKKEFELKLSKSLQKDSVHFGL